jgi:hypothetical protein
LLWISGPLDTFNFDNLDLKPVNRFHIQMVDIPRRLKVMEIFFGTDYQGGTISSSRPPMAEFQKKVVLILTAAVQLITC